MLTDTAALKVTAAHLSRTALLYVRQSSLKQVIHNTESAIRQYDLRGKAIALGWAADQVTVIDIDQGRSGASAADREGFQQLVAEVSLGRAGIVLGLECSRLARNNADWHQLLELCAVTGTLICDEDGLYDPRSFNDRMLLGLKGTMAESELHFIKARLRGGQLSKARRGELVMPLPIGLAYDAAGHVVLDPDAAIQGAVRHLLATFEATGSATAIVKAFNAAGLTFPWRHRKGPRKDEVDWQPLGHHTVLRILHNPRYAGCFTYGRTAHQIRPGGKDSARKLPRDQWTSFIPGAHPGYITLDQYEANIARLTANAAAHGRDRTAGPPREGPALLQGLIICGRCGNRMTIRYHHRRDQQVPTYMCQRDGIENGRPACAAIPGGDLDHVIGQLLITALTPARRRGRPPGLRRARAPGRRGRRPARRPRRTRATSLTWPAAATWPSTPPTGSSPAPSKPTGTPPCERSTTRREPATRPAASTPGSSPKPTRPASASSPPTCPPSGTAPPPRSGSASASPACCSPTSPRPGPATPSPPTSAWPADSTAPSPSRHPCPSGTSAAPPPTSSPPSTTCSTSTPPARSPASSTSEAWPAAPARDARAN
jgi:DNA invertase Pin-like site-specific DNA recombinase